MAGLILVLYPKGWGHYPHADVFLFFRTLRPVICCADPEVASQFAPGIETLLPRYTDVFPIGQGSSIATSYIPALDSIVEKLRPEVVVTFEAYSSLTFQASRLSRRYTFGHVVLCNETGSSLRSAWGIFPVTAFFAAARREGATTFLGFTNKAVDSLVSGGIPRRQIRQFLPGIDLSPYLQQVDHQSTTGLAIVYLGSLRKNKGLLTLHKAFTELDRRSPGRYDLTIGGVGPLSDLVKRWEARSNNVHYAGWIDNAQKPRFLRNGDVFVYPSEDVRLAGILRWQEQTAISVMEAMATGLTVVASDSGALPEILDQPEMTFHQGASSQLAAILFAVETHRELLQSRGLTNKRRAEQRFDIRRYALSLEKLSLGTLER
jgi:glycosyltransferase involved in cell wall biosynthesis